MINHNNSSEYEGIFLKTGLWTTQQAKLLIEDVEKFGITKTNTKKYKEILGRMNQWKKDLSQITGENWKNEN